jgi:Cof subfamily protein (haloacid dehalogenase superfamily)
MRPVEVKLVALDIDGTIVPPHAAPEEIHPSPRLAAAIARLRECGVAVVLASGRMFPGTADIARRLALDTPVICQQGCSVHEPGGRMLHEFPIERRAALEVIAYAREIGRIYEWFDPLRYVASADNAASREYGRVSGIEPEYRPDPENSGFAPTGVGIISSLEEAPAIHRHLVSHHGEALHLLDFPAVTVAVAPEANKGHALSLICEDLGVARHQVVAVGDSVNDAAMLAWAGIGYAMPHADRYAREAADAVLDGTEVEPVAALLEELARRRASGG